MGPRTVAHQASLALLVVAFAGIAVPCGGARDAPTRAALSFAPGSELRMEGTSTMHEWESRTATVNAVFTRASGQADPSGAAAIEAFIRADGVRGIEVQIPVATLHSERNGLDRNMMKSLQAGRFPTIHFRMQRYAVVSAAGVDTLRLRVAGELTVAGVDKDITLDARAWKSDQGEWVEGSEPLNMSEFGIKPPRLMLGALKVGNQVVIHYRLLLAPDTGPVGPQSHTEK